MALGACGGDDDPANPGTPESYSATVGFWNFLVADGSTDTRLDLFQDADSPLPSDVLPVDVDIHVNGQTISDLNYAEASAPVSFAARSADQDTMLIVPAGEAPNGSNEIIESQLLLCLQANQRERIWLVVPTWSVDNVDERMASLIAQMPQLDMLEQAAFFKVHVYLFSLAS